MFPYLIAGALLGVLFFIASGFPGNIDYVGRRILFAIGVILTAAGIGLEFSPEFRAWVFGILPWLKNIFDILLEYPA